MAGIPHSQVTRRRAQVDLRLDRDIRGYKRCSALFPVFNFYFVFETSKENKCHHRWEQARKTPKGQGRKQVGWLESGREAGVQGTSLHRH